MVHMNQEMSVQSGGNNSIAVSEYSKHPRSIPSLNKSKYLLHIHTYCYCSIFRAAAFTRRSPLSRPVVCRLSLASHKPIIFRLSLSFAFIIPSFALSYLTRRGYIES